MEMNGSKNILTYFADIAGFQLEPGRIVHAAHGGLHNLDKRLRFTRSKGSKTFPNINPGFEPEQDSETTRGTTFANMESNDSFY